MASRLRRCLVLKVALFFMPALALAQQPVSTPVPGTVIVEWTTESEVNQAGFNIFRVTERKAEREYVLEDIKDELPGVVSEMQFREKLDVWVKGLRAKAHIQINKS